MSVALVRSKEGGKQETGVDPNKPLNTERGV